MIAAMLSLGRATHQVPADSLKEAGVSQMFIAMNPEAFGPEPRAAEIADAVVASLHGCKPETEGRTVRYPGEQTLRVRAENEKLGLPVEEATWAEILAM